MNPAPTPWPRVAATVALLTLIISVLLTAFAWPAARSAVHDVPIAVAGPPAATAQVTAALAKNRPGAFEVTAVADTAAAEAAIKNREVYGAIDLTTGSPQVLTASAASPVVAQTLQAVATALAASPATTAGAPATTAVPVRDVVPLPADDPRGTGLAAAALPMVLGGMLAAVLLTARVRGTGRKVAGALGYAVLGGLAMAAILQFWLGSLEGDYLANSGVMALSLAATALTILGFESLLGTAGFGLGAVIMMLLGNPLSGATSAPEMLPGWSGTVGQFLPPGAASTLLRSVAFFDGNGALRPLVVLFAWLAAGALLCLVSGLRSTRRAGVDEAAEQSRPVAVPA
ncbi:ABC transporter permease [Actinoplanes sp. L3-i22]|uniref:ABC transporter permease n=1 Tax=Actinoplanes sp. L3-i22 TaxID=2836373 RepID=UPI001C77951B|nr:ABC transporter permease [Actinoplanes sp. L3-i22]BCY10452.1 membrane protein [Actinoplanes sp. L3-i22]